VAQRAEERTGRRTVNQDDWDRHPWSRTFDLISGAYGWTDDQILDLTPLRLHRIAQAIMLREESDFRRLARLQAAATRAVVAAVHGAAGNKKGVKSAEKVELLAPEDTVDDLADKLTPRVEVSTEAAVALLGEPLIPMED
jgi:hypothetical protein